MLLHTIRYQDGVGWSGPWPGGLDSERTLAVMFGGGTTVAARKAVAEVAAHLPRAVLMGCSSAGEICADRVQDGGLSVAIARFDDVALRKAALPITDPYQSRAVGQQLATMLAAPDLRAMFVLSDGLRVNGTQLAAGINSVLPDDVVVTGGLAGDGERFASTWVLAEGSLVSDWVTAVGLYGSRLRIGHGCSAGWSPFGPERRITAAAGNVLFELDGKPALGLYREYLGERAAGLPATALLFPLSIRRDADDAQPLIRTILGIDEASQSLTFAGDVPEGHRARLMRTSTDRLIQSAAVAASDAARGFPAAAQPLALAISCVGRRLVLGERTDEEIESVLDALPTGTGQVGFYSYGEMSPAAPGGCCDLHNQTMTVTVLDEWPAAP